MWGWSGVSTLSNYTEHVKLQNGIEPNCAAPRRSSSLHLKQINGQGENSKHSLNKNQILSIYLIAIFHYVLSSTAAQHIAWGASENRL